MDSQGNAGPKRWRDASEMTPAQMRRSAARIEKALLDARQDRPGGGSLPPPPATPMPSSGHNRSQTSDANGGLGLVTNGGLLPRVPTPIPAPTLTPTPASTSAPAPTTGPATAPAAQAPTLGHNSWRAFVAAYRHVTAAISWRALMTVCHHVMASISWGTLVKGTQLLVLLLLLTWISNLLLAVGPSLAPVFHWALWLSSAFTSSSGERSSTASPPLPTPGVLPHGLILSRVLPPLTAFRNTLMAVQGDLAFTGGLGIRETDSVDRVESELETAWEIMVTVAFTDLGLLLDEWRLNPFQPRYRDMIWWDNRPRNRLQQLSRILETITSRTKEYHQTAETGWSHQWLRDQQSAWCGRSQAVRQVASRFSDDATGDYIAATLGDVPADDMKRALGQLSPISNSFDLFCGILHDVGYELDRRISEAIPDVLAKISILRSKSEGTILQIKAGELKLESAASKDSFQDKWCSEVSDLIAAIRRLYFEETM